MGAGENRSENAKIKIHADLQIKRRNRTWTSADSIGIHKNVGVIILKEYKEFS